MAKQAKAGWYADSGQPGNERYWDGNQWTDQCRVAPPTKEKKQRGGTFTKVVLGVLVGGVLLIGGCAAIIGAGLNSTGDNEPRAKRTGVQPAATPPRDPAPNPSAPTESVSEANARASADRYLSIKGFSRSGLIKQLKFEGFSTADATYGVDAVSVDWNEQATKSAKNYLSISSFSRSGLIKQLKFEGFTEQQAVYGVSQTGL